MAEYYLIYRTEKGKPKSATHATFIGEQPANIIKALEAEIENRYGNEAFELILYKKQKVSVSDAVWLKRLVADYEDDDVRFRGNRNHVLYEIEYFLEDLTALQNDPDVVWSVESVVPIHVAKATEYFVTYYRTIYPDCRDAGQNDYEAHQLQDSKTCFESHCEDCESKRPYCNWDWCHSRPHTCNTADCPESSREMYCRVSIGNLTPGELDTFKELTDIEKDNHFSLLPSEAIQKLTPAERVKHNRLIACFKFNEENRKRNDVPF